MTASEYLRQDINKYKSHYQLCDELEKPEFRKRLDKYKWQFDRLSDFIRWYLEVTK